jgi:hypothetical protein
LKTFPTYGYKDDGSAQIFDLKEGESLPAGWEPTPKPWNHPNSKHLHPRPAHPGLPPPDPEAVHEETKKRGRPPLIRDY